jgi:hypothetical protein
MKSLIKKKRFKFVLEVPTDEQYLIDMGRSFHKLGAATAKYLLPKVFKLQRGLFNKFFEDDLRVRPGL